MICLRNLTEKDAPYMLEWMHDVNTQKCFRKNMLSMTLEQVTDFCRKSSTIKNPSNGESLHLAVVDDENDEYLGTISLKEFDADAKNAEYAISMREKARGTGAAQKATLEILKLGFCQYGLHRIYLNVLSDNKRAARFYEKCGFVYEGEARDCLVLNGKYASLKYFGMLDLDYQKMMYADNK